MNFDLTNLANENTIITIKDEKYVIDDTHQTYQKFIKEFKSIKNDNENMKLILSLGIENYDLFKSKNYPIGVIIEVMYVIMSNWTGKTVEEFKKHANKVMNYGK